MLWTGSRQLVSTVNRTVVCSTVTVDVLKPNPRPRLAPELQRRRIVSGSSSEIKGDWDGPCRVPGNENNIASTLLCDQLRIPRAPRRTIAVSISTLFLVVVQVDLSSSSWSCCKVLLLYCRSLQARKRDKPPREELLLPSIRFISVAIPNLPYSSHRRPCCSLPTTSYSSTRARPLPGARLL
nr:hypothetical protein CFP56_25975 [Quercus suber]